MKTSKIILTSFIVAASVLASRLTQHRTQARIRGNDALLRQRANQVVEMAAENQRLSNLVIQIQTNTSTANDRRAELAKLHATLEALRWQTNQLAKLAEERRLIGEQFFARGDLNLLEHNLEIAATPRGGPRATGKLNDARALTAALRKYADEHQGEFPLSFDQVTSYLPKPLEADSPSWADAPLTGTNDFEIIYQGSLNDLTDIPPLRVALIRERQPWPTPDGNWARVYGFADGTAVTVESDDNFQSWDAQHIIPASSASQ